MNLRITNAIMISNYTRNLQMNQQRMDKIESQIASNKRITRLSDDPVGVVKALKINTKLADIETYKTNISDAKGWLETTETAVTSMNSTVKRLYELSVRLANETNTPEDRMAAANEIRELRDQLVVTANTSMGDKFILGGYNVAVAPFEVQQTDPADPGSLALFMNGINMSDPANEAVLKSIDQDEIIRYKVGYQIDLGISMTGVGVLGTGENNAFKIMNDFYNACMKTEQRQKIDDNGNLMVDAGGNPVMESFGVSTWEDIQPFIGKFQSLQRELVADMAELGGRQNRLDLMNDGYDVDIISYKDQLGKVEEIDMAEAITRFSMAEAVYRAALGIGSRVIQPTLMDFMN